MREATRIGGHIENKQYRIVIAGEDQETPIQS